MRGLRKVLTLLLASAILSFSFLAEGKKLTFKQAFEGKAYTGKKGEKILNPLPRFIKWLDGESFLQMAPVMEKGKQKYRLQIVNIKTGKKKWFDPENSKYLPKGLKLESFAAISENTESFIFNWKGDLYYYCTKTHKFKRLTASKSPEKNPKFSPNGKLVAYTRDHNLYVMDIKSGLEYQLTDDGSDRIYNGWASWVYYEEILGRRTRYAAFWWAPNSEMIAFFRFDDREVPTFPLFREEGTHGKLEITPYPKPGDPNPKVKLGIAHVKTGKIVWVDIDESQDHYLGTPFWSPDSSYLIVQWLNRGQDHLVLYAADPNTGKVKKIYEERQSSWVDFFSKIYFLEKGKSFLLISDKDGWAHIYHYDRDGKFLGRLTRGEWRVRSIAGIDERKKIVYLTGFKSNSTENHLFSVKLDGTGLKRITKEAGTHRIYMAPNCRHFVDFFENIHTPPKMLLRNEKGKVIKKLADSWTPEFAKYRLGKVELFTIPSGDGYNLPAFWILPPDFDPSKKYPVLIWIYGGPDAAMVRNSFPRLSRFYLAQQGIIVLTVDHRASGHFGKKGVALMHRNLGKWEMHDYIAAVKWLRKKPFVDSKRIGITGGSYGGYVTCMALTYGADYFTHGVAAFPVTDWRLYDTVYTERYMDTPEENPEGYKKSSVLTYAERLKGKLLIVHGTIDDNVHPQHTLQFISKLEDLNKDFELLMYPGCRHGWRGPKWNHYNREFVEFWFKYFLNREFDPEKD